MTDNCCKDDLPPLPQTTEERLREVAKIVREENDRYYQTAWATDFEENTVLNLMDVLGRGNVCDTKGCQAGWAVALTPPEQMPISKIVDSDWQGTRGPNWNKAGALALGLETRLANVMFEQDYGHDASSDDVADVLEYLALFPAEERTLELVEEGIPDLWDRVTHVVSTCEPDCDCGCAGSDPECIY